MKQNIDTSYIQINQPTRRINHSDLLPIV